MKALIAFALSAVLLLVACNIHPEASAPAVERFATVLCFILSVVFAWVGIVNTEQ